MCEVKTIKISSDFVDWEFRPGRTLAEGIAHASLHVEDVIETRSLAQFRADDNNLVRHGAIFALFDWCWGGDEQGLIALKNENSFYSHDHGWYFPPVGANWSSAELEANVETPHELTNVPTGGITPAIIEPFACALETITQGQLIDVLSHIPLSWAVTDVELESLGFFLEKRAPMVAGRLRAKFGGNL